MSKEKENKISKDIIDNILDLSIEKINTIKEDIKDKSFEESIEYFKNHKIIKCFIDLFPLAKEGFEDYIKYKTSSKNRKYEGSLCRGDKYKNEDVSKDEQSHYSNDQFFDSSLEQVSKLITENFKSFEYFSKNVILPVQAELILLGYNKKMVDSVKLKFFLNTNEEWKKISNYPFIKIFFTTIFTSYTSSNMIERIRKQLPKIYFLDVLPILEKYIDKNLTDEKIGEKLHEDLDKFNKEVCKAFDTLISFLIELELIEDLSVFKKDSLYLKLSLNCYGFEISRILDVQIKSENSKEIKEDKLFFKLKQSGYLSNMKEIFLDNKQLVSSQFFNTYGLKENKNRKDRFYDESIMRNYPMFAKLFQYYVEMFNWDELKDKNAELDKIRDRLLLLLSHEIAYRYFASYPEDDDELINLNIEKIKGYVKEPLVKVFYYLEYLYNEKDWEFKNEIDTVFENQLKSINYDNLFFNDITINIFKK